MAVWQLDGPTPIKGLPPNVPSVYVEFGEWWPGVGLIMRGDFGDFGIVTLDGQYQKRTHNLFGMNIHWVGRQRMIRLQNETVPDSSPPRSAYMEIGYEPMATFGAHVGPTEECIVDVGPPAYTNYIRLKDRRLWVSFGQIFSVKIGSTVTEVEGPHINFSFDALVHSGRNEHEIWISSAGANPKGIFYDTVTKEFSSPYMYIEPTTPGVTCRGFQYVPEYGVFVSTYTGQGGFHMRVWSLEVKPTKIGPVEIAEGVVKSGQIVTYRAKVTGDQGDAASEFVNWALLGAGTLLDVQSKTDETGYASAKVQYGLTEVGPSTVKASVLC